MSAAQTRLSLHDPVQYVKGIGPKRAEALKEHGILRVYDLLYYFPFGYINLGNVERIANCSRLMGSDRWVTAIGTIRALDLVGRPPRQRLIIILGDETGTIPLIFFRSVSYFKKAFSPGDSLAVSGKVTGYRNRPQFIHPSIDRLTLDDEDGDPTGFLHTSGLVPKYGSSENLRDVNLHVKGLRRIVRSVLDDFLGLLADHLPEELRNRLQLADLRTAISNIHFPDSAERLEQARRRLKFDELFTLQVLLALKRSTMKDQRPGIPFGVKSAMARSLVDGLPFRLTNAQKKVIKEITEDMKSGKPMNRLLQGDVGSGKTVVALTAMIIAVENGYQAAFMAPTEILAEQHFHNLTRMLAGLPVTVRLLVGGQKSRLREDLLADIRSGKANIIVGTHALIQEQVEFARLGFIVIDEQHRFGVAQRLALREKAADASALRLQPDILVMTATPIPRTLSLTLYGDLDVSVINELPKERKAVKTVLFSDSQHESLYKFIREQISAGRQAYIVYPLIEESEKLDLRAATESYEELRTKIFPDLRVGLLHGKMPAAEKEAVMGVMKEGKIDILVATTVVEVGIDIANASVMVIQHAERFGLSQLHQLRGRVGRGAEQSFCLLVTQEWLARGVKREAARFSFAEEDAERQKSLRRLSTMLETTDGFKIAEIDLELRGPGEFFGTRQSGIPELQIANLVTDGEILTTARAEAFRIVQEDPHLRLPEHQPLRKQLADRWKEALAYMQVG
jgi:ATP-dependent DNA helicase RecG